MNPASSFFSRFLSPAADEACQYVTGIVGKNPLLLRELNLSECELGDTRVNQISALLLRKCGLTEESCSALATVLRSNSSLKELDMSNNNLQDSGVKKLQNGLENINCTLEKLGTLFVNSLSHESCSALATVLRSNSSLKELDMRNNNLQDSGVKKLGLENTNCTLEKLRLSNCSITEEGYKAMASALRSNPSHLIELDLTGNYPGPSGVKQLSDILQDGHYQLKTIR
uniref:Uncharacterized protein n=1 Tax=Sinocyclocheilus rhinocerous TaxID=307959 RepID=A0A673I515_9TELE